MATTIIAIPNQYPAGTTPSIDSPKLADGVTLVYSVKESKVIKKPKATKDKIINVSGVTLPDKKSTILLRNEILLLIGCRPDICLSNPILINRLPVYLYYAMVPINQIEPLLTLLAWLQSAQS